MPQALVDAFLLKRFPGRTLEELDEMDWARYNKALEAMDISDVEEKQISLQKGLIKSNAVSQKDWDKFEAHALLLEEDENGELD